MQTKMRAEGATIFIKLARHYERSVDVTYGRNSLVLSQLKHCALPRFHTEYWGDEMSHFRRGEACVAGFNFT